MTRPRSQELAEHLMVPFPSGEQPLVTLFMDVMAPAHGGPWPALLVFHGWHQDLTHQRERARALARKGFCALNLNLRGRCGTVGQPDANGWEIRDAWDAVTAARRFFPQLCADTLPARAFGVSGGGGNVYALAGKCPDLLSSAVVWCGVSDYARWFEWNEAGNYRDEMEKWIAPNPREHKEAYQSRSGLFVASNRICPLKIVHGKEDASVPIDQGRMYYECQRKNPDAAPLDFQEVQNLTHDIPDNPYLEQAADFLLANGKPVYVPQRGLYAVAGFIRTHYFEARWARVDMTGTLDLDMRRRRAILESPSSHAAQLRLAGLVKGVELLDPERKCGRVLAVRQQAGWSVIDLQLHGGSMGIRWKV